MEYDLPCGCTCHRDPTFEHKIECCTRCRYCGLNLPDAVYWEHLWECEQEDLKRNPPGPKTGLTAPNDHMRRARQQSHNRFPYKNRNKNRRTG